MGPRCFEHVELPDPEPGEGEVLIEVARSGINFADTHATRNDYLAEQALPLIPGGEVSGRTLDGRRVAALLANGGYAEKAVAPEALLVPIPDQVNDDQAAALLLQGLTAMALVRRCAASSTARRSSSRPPREAPARFRSSSRSEPERR